MSQAFLIDENKQASYTYAELIADLNTGPHQLACYFSANNTYEVFRAYILVLLCELNITLLDIDFSIEEVESLITNTEKKDHKFSCQIEPKIRDEADLVQRLRQASKGRVAFFTSGTTGLPKRVTHEITTLAKSVKLSPKHAESIWAFAYNPTHIAGCQVFMQAIMNGNTIVDVFNLNPQKIRNALLDYGATHISATPTFYRMLMPVDEPITSVSRVTFGGERMDPKSAEHLQQAFPSAKLLNIYASTEGGTILTSTGDEFSIKEELENLVRIIDNQLIIHHSLLGVFDDSAQPPEDDWYATGDIVSITSENPLRFKILHRSNELINVGGYKVNPAEVETILRAMNGVADARVFAEKNSVLGNLVCCDVALSNPDLNERMIRQYLTANLQPFKIPRLINFVDAIETTRTGKLKRNL